MGRLLAQPDVQQALLTCQVRCNSDCGWCTSIHCLQAQLDQCARDASHVPCVGFDKHQSKLLGKICTCAVGTVQILFLQHCRQRSCAERIRYQCNARRFCSRRNAVLAAMCLGTAKRHRTGVSVLLLSLGLMVARAAALVSHDAMPH